MFLIYDNNLNRTVGVTETEFYASVIDANYVLHPYTEEAYQDFLNYKDSISVKEVVEPTPLIIEPTELELMRRKHLDVIKSLCQLSGIEYNGKMTNLQYEAMLNDLALTKYAGQASLLAVSLLYTRNVLRELDGENWWDNIEGL